MPRASNNDARAPPVFSTLPSHDNDSEPLFSRGSMFDPPPPGGIVARAHVGRPSSSPRIRQRMQRVLDRLQETDATFQAADPYPPAPSRPAPGRRAQLSASQSRGVTAPQLHRERTDTVDEDARKLADANARLAQLNEDVRVIDEINQELLEARELATEAQTGHTQHATNQTDALPTQGRRKRRRIEEEPQCKRPKIEYGYHGQGVSGKLIMQIMDCDGGTIEPPRHAFDEEELEHTPENLLLDDASVYCTREKQCNLVLRHQGETTFSLERLVIKAPKSGFTDP